MYGVCSALIVYGLAVWEMRGNVSYPDWAAYLGAASYSVYLIHTFLLGWIGKGVAKIIVPGSAPSLLYFAVAIGAVSGGCALYQFVERPLQTLIRSISVRNAYDGIAPPRLALIWSLSRSGLSRDRPPQQ